MSKSTIRWGLIIIAAAALGAGACKKKDDGGGAARGTASGAGTASGTAAGTAAAAGSGTAAGSAEAPSAAEPDVDTEAVTYNAGGTILKGYLAAPKGPGKHPGVLVVHEWWGQNDYARMRARRLAGLGYVALAVDMYGDGKTADNPSDAGKLAGEATKDPEVTKARFVAARELLAKDPRVDGDKIGAIGYCFGGGVALTMLRMGVPLDAVASFHGTLKTDHPAAKDSFHGRVLIEAGGGDPFVPQADVDAVEAELTAAGAQVQVDVYPGATHAFTNPAATEVGKKFDLPIAYDPDADAQSWEQLVKLFARTWPST